MYRAKILLEQVEAINVFSEENIDPETVLKADGEDEEENTNESEDDDMIDNEDDENPEDDAEEQIEQVEMKFLDTLTDVGLTACDAEVVDNSLNVDMAFDNGETATVQVYVEDGEAKAVVLTDGTNEEEMKTIDLPAEFVDEEGNLVVDVDKLPVDEIKNAISDVVDLDKTEEPQVEAYRFKNGIVESFTKKMKKEKKASMKYKKESKKKAKKRK